MTSIVHRLPEDLDKVDLFKQELFGDNSQTLANDIRSRVDETGKSSFEMEDYLQLVDRSDKGRQLLERATPIEKSSSSILRKIANRVLSLTTYVIWTAPLGFYSWLTTSRVKDHRRNKGKMASPQEGSRERATVSLSAIDAQLATFEKNKSYYEIFSLNQKAKAPYEPSDLNRIALALNKATSIGRCCYVALGRLTFRTVQLQLQHSIFVFSRLKQVQERVIKLFRQVVDEMRNSPFFRKGAEDSQHLTRIFTRLNREQMIKVAKDKLKEVDFFNHISTPIANDSISSTHCINPLNPINPARAQVKKDLVDIIDRAQDILMNVLEKEALCIHDQGWVNRERGISNFLNWNGVPNLTLEERLTSILGGLIVLEYFKQHAQVLQDFACHLNERETAERNAYLQSRVLAEEKREAYIQGLIHLTFASGATLLRKDRKYLIGQVVETIVSLVHQQLDPKQESQTLQALAFASKTLMQLYVNHVPGSLISIGIDFIKSMLVKCGIYGICKYATEKPSQEMQDAFAGLLLTGITNEDRYLVSAGLFLVTSKMNDFLQAKARDLDLAGYKECAKWVSRIAEVIKTNSAVNAVLTDEIVSRHRALSDPDSEIPSIEEDELDSFDESCIDEVEIEGQLEQQDIQLEKLASKPQPPAEGKYSYKKISGKDCYKVKGGPGEASYFPAEKKAAQWVENYGLYEIAQYNFWSAVWYLRCIYYNNGHPIPDAIQHHFPEINIKAQGGNKASKVYLDGNEEWKGTYKHSASGAFEVGRSIIESAVHTSGEELGAALDQAVKDLGEVPGLAELRQIAETLENITFATFPKTYHPPKEKGFFAQIFRKIDRLHYWLAKHKISVNAAVSTSIPLPISKPASTTYEETRHQVMLAREELAQMEQKVDQQISTNQTVNTTNYSSCDQSPSHSKPVTTYEHPTEERKFSTQPVASNLPLAVKRDREQERPQRSYQSSSVLEKYEDGELAQSNIPTWLRWGANPDRISLDPKEEVAASHAQLAAHSTSVARFFGGITDTIRSWGSSSSNLDTRGRLHQNPTETERLESLAERAVPYDRTQPGYQMLQTASDVAVDTLGFSIMGGIGTTASRGINVSRTTGLSGSSVPCHLKGSPSLAAKTLTEGRAFLEEMQQPAYRSGFGKQQLMRSRDYRVLEPVTLPKISRSEQKWFKEATDKVDYLKNEKGKRFDHFLRKSFKNDMLSEVQIRRILNYSGFKTYPRPKGLPRDCVVELSKENGGMIYRRLGTSSEENLIVRVMDGARKENVVTASMEGRYLGRWRQQTPYVVQRKGGSYLTRDGSWIDKDKPELTHIPLEVYEFKGWE